MEGFECSVSAWVKQRWSVEQRDDGTTTAAAGPTLLAEAFLPQSFDVEFVLGVPDKVLLARDSPDEGALEGRPPLDDLADLVLQPAVSHRSRDRDAERADLGKELLLLQVVKLGEHLLQPFADAPGSASELPAFHASQDTNRNSQVVDLFHVCCEGLA